MINHQGGRGLDGRIATAVKLVQFLVYVRLIGPYHLVFFIEVGAVAAAP